jgi:hypothetical protein
MTDLKPTEIPNDPSRCPAPTLQPISFSSGVPNRYGVLGLPDGQTAEIALKRVRSIEMWKFRIGETGRYRGKYRTAEDALARDGVSGVLRVRHCHASPMRSFEAQNGPSNDCYHRLHACSTRDIHIRNARDVALKRCVSRDSRGSAFLSRGASVGKSENATPVITSSGFERKKTNRSRNALCRYQRPIRVRGASLSLRPRSARALGTEKRAP